MISFLKLVLGGTVQALFMFTPVLAAPIISEFQASNDSVLIDGDGAYSDWIEIYNPDSTAVDLTGWYLTDTTNNLTKWTFPAVSVNSEEFLLVMASGQNDPNYFDGTYWHTTFKLDFDGEYLALVAPDGTNIVSEYHPGYPPQVSDIAYGVTWQTGTGDSNLTFSSTAAVHVPTNGVLSTNWISTSFSPDASWQQSPGPGVGFDLDGTNASSALVASWGLDESSGESQILDGSGNSYHGVARAGVTLGEIGANANTGTAAKFINTSIDVAYNPALNPDSFTFAAWVYPASGGSGHRSPLTNRMDDGSAVRGYLLYINPANVWEFWTGGGGASGSWEKIVGPAAVFDTWIHVAISFDDATSTKTFYLNGSIVGQTTAQGYTPNIARDLHIGAGADNGGSFRWHGDIDDCILWNEAVDPNIITAHMNDGNASATAISFHPLIDLNLEADMFGQQPGAYMRLPFDLTSPTDYNRLALHINFDDGFVAYLNGQQVAATNVPPTVAWNSTANLLREDEDGLDTDLIDLTAHLGLLQTGTNVLAIHGLNKDASEPDFLLRPELVGTILGAPTLTVGYLDPASPGEINPTTPVLPGPIIETVTHLPQQPLAGESLTVTATVTPRLAAIDTVSLHWRVNYGAINNLIMTNNLAGGFTATFSGYSAGDMVRWYVDASDTGGGIGRAPTFLDQESKSQSPEYFGTFIPDPAITSLLPILYWRTDDVANSDTRIGARASVFYEGQFYDNIFVRQRGGFTSLGSQKFDFNKGDPIYVNEKIGKVGELNLNTKGNDGTFIRQPLAFQMYEVAQAPAPESFNVLQVRNGSIQRVSMLIEQVDEDFLDRFDFDDQGALYKFVQRNNLNPMLNDTLTGVEKKTRLHEGFGDMDEFIDAIKNGTLAERQREMFDRVDLPRFTNFMAAKTIVRDVDSIRKNLYLYRDTRGSGEWMFIPWDEDFSFGIGGGGSFLNHPYLGDSTHKLGCCDQWNVLYDLYNNTPLCQEMFGRRLRTLLDEMIGPPGTATNASIIEQRADELIAKVTPHTGTNASSIKNWVPGWRNNLYNNFGPGGSEELIAAAQSAQPSIQFGTIDFNPVDGQDAEYIELINPDPNHAVDLSNWTLTGGVTFAFVPGTVIPAGTNAFLSPNRAEFRSRTVGPTGNEGRLVIGNYSGHLNNYGEPLTLADNTGALIHSLTYTGQLTEAQQYLVISEIMHNPTHHTDAEYIELLNISTNQTLDLTDVAFTEGIDFVFPTNTLLAPGGRVLVVKDAAHFATNAPIAGVFANNTRLDSNGEGLKLDDDNGNTVHEFTYRTTSPWPTGTGLVLIAPYTRPDPSIGYHWRSNAATPGTTDGYLATHPPPASVSIREDKQLSFTFDILAENVAIALELSDDLVTWTTAGERVEFLSMDADGTMHWALRPPESDKPRSYSRVRSTLE